MVPDKIKIIHVIEQLERGGTEMVLKNLLTFMDNDRYELYVISFSKESAIRLPDNVKLFLLSKPPFEIKNKRVYLRISKTLELRRLIQSISPDIIHSHLNNHKIFSLLLSTLGLKLKYITTIHTCCSHYQKKSFSINWFIESLTIKALKIQITTVSSEISEYIHLRKLSCKINFIANGIDTDTFSRKDPHANTYLKKELCIGDNDIVVIHTGRFNRVKDHESIVRAMKIIIAENKNVKLLLIGKRGGEYEYIKHLIIELGLQNYIKCLGEIDNIIDILSIADLGVFPSLSEGLSLALIEMMSMQLPVVVTDIQAFRYIYKNVEGVEFIPVRSPDKLAQGVLRLINNKQEALVFGYNSRQKIVSDFSIYKQVDSYSKLYNNMVYHEK